MHALFRFKLTGPDDAMRKHLEHFTLRLLPGRAASMATCRAIFNFRALLVKFGLPDRFMSALDVRIALAESAKKFPANVKDSKDSKDENKGPAMPSSLELQTKKSHSKDLRWYLHGDSVRPS